MHNFLTVIFLGTVVVQPEPVLNEDKDDFKGPEFRNRNTTRVKPEIPKKRGGKCNMHHVFMTCLNCSITAILFLESIQYLSVPRM